MLDIIKKLSLLIVEIIVYVIIAVAVAGGLYFLTVMVSGQPSLTEINFDTNPIDLLVQNYIPQTIGVLLALFIVKLYIFPIEELKLGFTKHKLTRDLGIGWVYGMVLVGIGFIILYVFGQLEILGSDWESKVFFGFLALFLVQSFSEEVVFRSFLIPAIEQRLGTFAALNISSILFFVLHLSNPNASGLGMINLFFGGILMGLLFLKYRNVWVPTGFHASWNFIQSTLLGFPVSGHDTYSYIELRETGHDYITGGPFGYEGSIISIAILIVSIVILLIKDDALYNRLFKPVHHSA